MRYQVTYQLAGEERIDDVEADDAPTAAGIVRDRHGRSADLFELIWVHLMEPETEPGGDVASGAPSGES
jgi:hypothetical protein